MAVALAWLSPVQHWPRLLTYAYILPTGTRSVHTVPLADAQRLHVISSRALGSSFFFFLPRVHNRLKVCSKEFKMKMGCEFVLFFSLPSAKGI